MKIAVLTGGGDCPGLNAVIRAVVRRGEQHGLEVMGVREGWRGLLDPPLHDRLTREATSGILHLGGTILGTSRTNPFFRSPSRLRKKRRSRRRPRSRNLRGPFRRPG